MVETQGRLCTLCSRLEGHYSALLCLRASKAPQITTKRRNDHTECSTRSCARIRKFALHQNPGCQRHVEPIWCDAIGCIGTADRDMGVLVHAIAGYLLSCWRVCARTMSIGKEVKWSCQHSITTVTQICFIVSCYQEDYGNADPGCRHTDVRISERDRRCHSIMESRCFEISKRQ
jgi:hypothetical protein